jgi:hypothetical protein
MRCVCDRNCSLVQRQNIFPVGNMFGFWYPWNQHFVSYHSTIFLSSTVCGFQMSWCVNGWICMWVKHNGDFFYFNQKQRRWVCTLLSICLAWSNLLLTHFPVRLQIVWNLEPSGYRVDSHGNPKSSMFGIAP